MSPYVWKCKICDKQITYENDRSFDACLEHKGQYEIDEMKKREKGYESKFSIHKEIDEDDIIVCPYCFKELNDPWYEFIDGRDEDCQNVECPHCEEEFTAALRITYSITTKRK